MKGYKVLEQGCLCYWKNIFAGRYGLVGHMSVTKSSCGVHPALKRMVYMALWTFFRCSLVTIFIPKGSRDYVTLGDYRVLLWEGFRMGGVKNVSFSNKGSSHCGKTSFVWRAGHTVQGIHVQFCNVSSLRGNLALTGCGFYCAILTIPLVYLPVGLKILNPWCLSVLESCLVDLDPEWFVGQNVHIWITSIRKSPIVNWASVWLVVQMGCHSSITYRSRVSQAGCRNSCPTAF